MDNLAMALAKVQAEMGLAEESGYNPHFKSSFSTFKDLVKASRGLLVKHGLCITQYPHSIDNNTYLVTKLKHVSGQEEVSSVLILLKDPTDVQKLGSAISYIKRYVYASICGLATSEGDDDGNSIADVSGPRITSSLSQNNSTEVKSDTISPKQLGLLRAKLSGKPGKEQEICKYYQISSLALLPWKKMQEVLTILEAGEKSPKDDQTEWLEQ